MKRSTVVLPLVAATLGVAAPASAAPVPDFAGFDAFSGWCTEDADGETCTNVFMNTGEGSDGAGSISLDVSTLRIVGGEVVEQRSEFGFASTRGISVDRSLN